MVKDVHAQLSAKIKELGSQIEKSYRANKVPADYSLGVANGLILADHIVNARQGKPKFFDRTTAIGVFPRPVVLKSENAIRDDATYQYLVERILLATRNFVGGILPKEGLEIALEQLAHFNEAKIEELSNLYEANRQT